MLVRCPRCRAQIRFTDVDPHDRMVRYLCATCRDIVDIDLVLDEVRAPKASGSFDRIRRRWHSLVADDSPASAEVAAGILREIGHETRVVHDGHAAVDDIRRFHPDLVLVDLMLPGLSGVDVLRAVRAEARLRATLVLVVGSVWKPDVIHYLNELGAAGYVDRERIVSSLAFRVRGVLDGSPLTPTGGPGRRHAGARR
ncbi:MAG: response regulator [Acidobacteriota bacterium]